MYSKHQLRAPVSICAFLLFLAMFSQAAIVKTPAEQTNYTEYSQHEAITRFLSELDYVSKEISVQIIGRTMATQNFEAKDIYLCIITEEGADCPHKLNREKPTFLLIASQHGNEQSAKEAALWLVRDLSTGELKPLLKKMNFLVIPQANPYGNWFNQRRNEQNLDLNRDHVKLESPEVEAIHDVFRTWMPEATMDVHEKGDDYYQVSIGCVSNINIHPDIQDLSRNTVLPEVEKSLKAKRITFHEYLVTQEMGIDSSAGVTYSQEDLKNKERMKRYSTTDLNDGRNSLGIYETLSFIQEGSSRHDIATLKDRTKWQYYGMRFLAQSIARHGEEINALVRGLRKDLLEKAKKYSEEDIVHLRMKYARDEKQSTLTIKMFERSEAPIRGILKVDKKAGDILTMDDISPYPFPSKYKVVEEAVKNWFPNVEPIISVQRPLAYILPAKYHAIAELLIRHGLRVDIFAQDSSVDVEAYQVSDVVPAEYDYLAPVKIDVEPKALNELVKKGDYYISCVQDGANLIPSLLEPQSLYGLIRYWKLQLVPEKGSVFPFYRVIKAINVPLMPYKNWKK